MGKSEPQLPLNNRHHQQNRNRPSFFLQCSTSFSRVARLFSFKCVVILLLSVSVSLSAIFSVFHFHRGKIGFDANDSIKSSASVQGYFKLEKHVSFLIPQIARLEYDINDEIGVPDTQVTILSMHKCGPSNCTDVVFGVLSKPINSPINPVSLSVLRSSLVEVFTERSNLTLTKSIFGVPCCFEILKFPGGITIIPKLSPPVWVLPQVLFNFTLPNSLHEIEESFLALKEQLKSGLQLMPYESVFVQVTNKEGSTEDPPVTVQASVVSTLGGLDPVRLKELAREIRGAKNLGLDNSVFGKVKEISLSSYLYHTLDAPTPAPAPAPNDHMGPTISPEYGPIHSPSPAPAVGPSCDGGSHMSPASPPPVSDHPDPPDLSPLPGVNYGSGPDQENGHQKGLTLAPSPLPSSSKGSESVDFSRIMWSFFFIILHMV